VISLNYAESVNRILYPAIEGLKSLGSTVGVNSLQTCPKIVGCESEFDRTSVRKASQSKLIDSLICPLALRIFDLWNSKFMVHRHIQKVYHKVSA
jgi:hypothetical protein